MVCIEPVTVSMEIHDSMKASGTACENLVVKLPKTQ